MQQYKTYLRAELGKLKNVGDGREFIDRSGCRLGDFGLVADPKWLAEKFTTQQSVDDYVETLDANDLVGLTSGCGQWRGNGIAKKLSVGQRVECWDVAVENIVLSPAERELEPVFSRLDWQLVAIASDPNVLAADAFRLRGTSETVAFRCCLANPVPARPGVYKVFDGMHRAIQMVRNGEAQIPLCVVIDP